MKKGFTLLEILVSISILAFVSTLMAQVLFTTTHVNKKTELVSDVKQNGNFVLDVIGRMVRGASFIDSSCAQDAPFAPSVQITGPDTYVTTLECLSDGKAARIASVSATDAGDKIEYLSAGNLTVSEAGGSTCDDSTLEFNCRMIGSIQTQLGITFTLGQMGGSGATFDSEKSSFQSVINLRN